MIVVKIEMRPHGDESKAYPLGRLDIWNDGRGTAATGNYEGRAYHAGKFWGRRREPFKQGRVVRFGRHLSPYRLVARMLQAMREV